MKSRERKRHRTRIGVAVVNVSFVSLQKYEKMEDKGCKVKEVILSHTDDIAACMCADSDDPLQRLRSHCEADLDRCHIMSSWDTISSNFLHVSSLGDRPVSEGVC